MKAVLTVTPNPAVDMTVAVAELHPGEVVPASWLHQQAGGKGINVATMLASGTRRITATGFLGASNTPVFSRHMAAHGIEDAFVRIPGETRSCLKIVEQGHGRTTDVNLPGPIVDPTAQATLGDIVRRLAKSNNWVSIGGSLAPGTDPKLPANLIAEARGGGASVAVDCSGPPLMEAIRLGVDLIKPNLAELREATALPLASRDDQRKALRSIHESGVKHVVLSLGADGAFFSTPEETVFTQAPPLQPASTTGAGDALLAGYLAGLLEGLDLPSRAELATLFCWSALEQVERHPPTADFLSSRRGRIRASRA